MNDLLLWSKGKNGREPKNSGRKLRSLKRSQLS